MALADDIAEAQQHLAAWKAADLALASSQSYTIGTRTITRADLATVRERIAYWERKLCGLQSGRGTGLRVFRVMPRDL